MPIFPSFVNLYLRLLLFSGACFGLIVGIYAGFTYGPETGIIAGVVMGVFFGLLLSSALFLMQFISVKMMPYELSEETLGVYQVRKLEMDVPYEEAFILCMASIGSVKGAKVTSEDKVEGRIDAKTGINWKTFGDDISIDILKTGHGERIRVVSRPSAMTAIVDYGQNLDNVEKIAGYLKANGATAPA